MEPRIYFVVQFDFPKPFPKEMGKKIQTFREALEGVGWIEEVFAASGGIGGGPSSMWVFRLQNYGMLNRLFNEDNSVATAYMDVIGMLENVQDKVREEVLFS